MKSTPLPIYQTREATLHNFKKIFKVELFQIHITLKNIYFIEFAAILYTNKELSTNYEWAIKLTLGLHKEVSIFELQCHFLRFIQRLDAIYP